MFFYATELDIKDLYRSRIALIVVIFDVGLWNQFLADAGLYESQEEAIRREEVLGRLDQVEFSSFLNLIFFKK